MRKMAKTEKGLYTKEQLMASRRYAGRRDLLDALLEKGKGYSLEEVDRKIEAFEKGMVR